MIMFCFVCVGHTFSMTPTTEQIIVLPADLTVTNAESWYSTHMVGGGTTFTFPNGRGASVIRHLGSYGGRDGLFEVAVINAEGNLDYTTDIAGDVIGWLDDEEVIATCREIAALPAE